MAYGLLQPDAGSFEWRGEAISIRSPQHARDLGIGMVFQHFSLFQALTVAENIALALPGGESIADLSARVRQMSAEYGIGVDPDARIHNLSVGEQQRVEIALPSPGPVAADHGRADIGPDATGNNTAL